MQENPSQPDKLPDLPQGHWFKIAERLYGEHGDKINPALLKVGAGLASLVIPHGEVSGMGGEKGKERSKEQIEKDKIIAKYLTNHPGVKLPEKTGSEGQTLTITSQDFRDIYPDGLPQELRDVLPKEVVAIMDTDYKHLKKIREKYGNTEDLNEVETPVYFFYLPGGVPLFLRGYAHDESWQRIHGKYFAEAGKYAEVIAIEGFVDHPLGESLNLRWANRRSQRGHYDRLMKDLTSAGFKGFYTEVDSRDESEIMMDVDLSELFPHLSPEFLTAWFDYLKQEHPAFAEKIKTPEQLREIARKQSTTDEGFFGRTEETVQNHEGKEYHTTPYLSPEGQTKTEMTFMELGQITFTDALSAIKLHIIARLMDEGKIPKGVIMDYEGANHLSNKSFFIRYPAYALEIVLRTINELMAGQVKGEDNPFRNPFATQDFSEMQEILKNPDWKEIFREIVKIPLAKVEDDSTKSVEIGPNQRKMTVEQFDVIEALWLDDETFLKAKPGPTLTP